ncbi:hypothetical protein VTK56DRAFT_7655 [Thermocarpiscus australiensis]
MSSQTGKWREEQVLIICPGSQSTLAQLGCNELTPPAHRFPTRMFRDEESDNWRPYHTYKRRKQTTGAGEDEWEYVEDTDSTEGAVYPIQAGRIVNMEAFLAFLEFVHSQLTTTYHNTPIMLMASPQWTRPDCEAIARYVFEKTKTPALCLIHSGIATQYGLKWPNMTVVDVGYEKVDVTCIYEGQVVSHKYVGAYPGGDGDGEGEISGGEVFTRRLLRLLEGQGFDYDMAEQLKKSPLCEVLPYAPENPDLMELPVESAAAVAGAAGEGPKIAIVDEHDTGLNGDTREIEEDGVLDVANIVASGQTREFLAKKEKEKQEKAEKAKAGRKGKEKEGGDAGAAKPVRLPNSKRTQNVFHYEELVTEDVPVAVPSAEENGTKDVAMPDAAPSTADGAEDSAATTGDANKTEPPTEQQPQPSAGNEAPASDAPQQPANPAEAAATATERVTRRVRRDIEVGLERFQFADRKEIDRIVTAIYRAVQEIDDMYMRPGCWENIVFVGNGARLRGLRDNIMQTLQARHLVSPSSATMFTSELPSNMGTPSGTGSQTPTSSFAAGAGALPHQLPTQTSSSGGVNPLLQAATTASLGVPRGGGVVGVMNDAGNVDAGGGHSHHHFHSQTPTNIRLAPLPSYLTEWSKHGFEEAMFLGAQVAARLAFCIHNLDAQGLESQRLMSLSRVDYNELGPRGIRTHSMLG